MEDAGFSAEETVALLSAHSIGKQHTIDAAIPGMPMDSSPYTFDSQYHLEVCRPSALERCRNPPKKPGICTVAHCALVPRFF